MKKTLFLLMMILSVLGGNPVPADATSYDELRQDYLELIGSPRLQQQRRHWEDLISAFESYVNSYPSATKAVFLLARTWDGLSRASGRSSDTRTAVDQYLEFVDRFPGSRLADDALLSAAEATEQRLKDLGRAAQLYRRVVLELPTGDMAGRAASRLAVIDPPDPAGIVPQTDNYQHHDNATGESPRLENIRYWSGPEYTRVVFDLSAPVVSQPHLLPGANPRLYFDLLYTRMAPGLVDRVPIRNGLVKQVRASHFNAQKTRVVLDLNRVLEYKTTILKNPHRLVIDIQGSPAQATLTDPDGGSRQGRDDSVASILDQSADRQPMLHVPQERRDDGIRLIVVDAGHGGRDPGAVGPNGILEKDVTLSMAKVLADQLRSRLGVKVLLTRTDDRYLELRERTHYANRVGADLFISLHANASPRGRAYGLETYFLNLSKNSQAAEVAARENGTSLEQVSHLEAILFDLMANAKINESSRLAAEVQQAMVSGLRPHYSHIKDLGVKQGPFHVLLGATMPSVLVETAFISHPREEKRLNSAGYRNTVATAISHGIHKYAQTIDQLARR